MKPTTEQAKEFDIESYKDSVLSYKETNKIIIYNEARGDHIKMAKFAEHCINEYKESLKEQPEGRECRCPHCEEKFKIISSYSKDF